MTKIGFTIDDSPAWHEFQTDFQLYGQDVPDVQLLSHIITLEQKRLQSGKAKRVEVYDNSGNLLAQTSDIMKWDIKYEQTK